MPLAIYLPLAVGLALLVGFAAGLRTSKVLYDRRRRRQRVDQQAFEQPSARAGIVAEPVASEAWPFQPRSRDPFTS